MATDERRPGRRAEIDAILGRKPGVHEVRDEAERYTVVGATERETYANWLTPIEEHYVCHRNAIPDIEDSSWTVSLTGLPGDEPVALSMATLREEYPTVAVAHTMECAGNGRGQHDPETGSVQWDAEGVGTAFWTGTPVSSVLRAHGLDADAGDGTEADTGDGTDAGNAGIDGRWLTAIGGDSIDEETFARSIPLSKALEDCLLAYGMNGEALPEEHGFPVRLVVPGWYGVNSVKWVEELAVADGMVTEGVLDRPGTHARWQQTDYRIHPRDAEPASRETVAEVDTEAQIESDAVEHPYTFDATVMSLIGRPTGTLDGGSEHREAVEVRGVAWAGDDDVATVEVSTDDGETWADADLFGPAYRGAWRLFRYDWTPSTGTHTLLSRATDEHERTQPERISSPAADTATDEVFPWNEGGYAANAVRPNAVEVHVEADGE